MVDYLHPTRFADNIYRAIVDNVFKIMVATHDTDYFIFISPLPIVNYFYKDEDPVIRKLRILFPKDYLKNTLPVEKFREITQLLSEENNNINKNFLEFVNNVCKQQVESLYEIYINLLKLKPVHERINEIEQRQYERSGKDLWREQKLNTLYLAQGVKFSFFDKYPQHHNFLFANIADKIWQHFLSIDEAHNVIPLRQLFKLLMDSSIKIIITDPKDLKLIEYNMNKCILITKKKSLKRVQFLSPFLMRPLNTPGSFLKDEIIQYNDTLSTIVAGIVKEDSPFIKLPKEILQEILVFTKPNDMSTDKAYKYIFWNQQRLRQMNEYFPRSPTQLPLVKLEFPVLQK